MDKVLLLTLEDIKRKVEKVNYPEKSLKKKEGILKEIDSIITRFNEIEVPDQNRDVYDSLVKKGRELLKDENIRDIGKVDYYVRYVAAAEYDFTDLKPLAKYLRFYMIMCACFFVLSPQYLTAALPLLFILPIYMGLKGVKARTRSGLMLSMTVVPVGITTALIWIINAFKASKNFPGFVEEMSKSFNVAYGVANVMLISFIILSVVLLITSILVLYNGLKYRKMFI